MKKVMREIIDEMERDDIPYYYMVGMPVSLLIIASIVVVATSVGPVVKNILINGVSRTFINDFVEFILMALMGVIITMIWTSLAIIIGMVIFRSIERLAR